MLWLFFIAHDAHETRFVHFKILFCQNLRILSSSDEVHCTVVNLERSVSLFIDDTGYGNAGTAVTYYVAMEFDG